MQIEHQKRQELKEIAEHEEIDESDTDKSIRITTKIKHVTYGRNHITMSMKISGLGKDFIVDTRSPVIVLRPNETLKKT